MARKRDKAAPDAAARERRGSTSVRMDSGAWKRKVKAWRKRLNNDPALAVCWLCGGAIDMNLPPTHGRAFTLDHLVPLSRGGDIDGEVKPAHRSCNAARGDGRKTKRGATPPTLLDW